MIHPSTHFSTPLYPSSTVTVGNMSLSRSGAIDAKSLKLQSNLGAQIICAIFTLYSLCHAYFSDTSHSCIDVSGFANIEESLTIGRMHANCRRICVFHLLKTPIPLISNNRHIYVFTLQWRLYLYVSIVVECVCLTANGANIYQGRGSH